jgi:hypothetical protein
VRPPALPLAAAGLQRRERSFRATRPCARAISNLGSPSRTPRLSAGSEDSLKTGQYERRNFWRKVGQLKGQQTASMAANGIDLGYGTATRVADDTQAGANEDAQNLYENIDQRTKGFIINNWNDRMQAKAAKAQGVAAFVGSGFQAGEFL